MNHNKYIQYIHTTALVVLFLFTTHNTTQAFTRNELNTMSISSEIARIVLTNAAMTQHNKGTGAAKIHTLASAAGLVNDLLECARLQEQSTSWQSTHFAGIVASLASHLIDLVTHSMNNYKSLPYTKINTVDRVAINGAQLLEVLIHYLGHCNLDYVHTSPQLAATSFHLHSIIEAVEKMLLVKHHASPVIGRQLYKNYLKATIALNAVLAGYQGIIGLQKKSPLVEPNPVTAPVVNQVVNPIQAPVVNQVVDDNAARLAAERILREEQDLAYQLSLIDDATRAREQQEAQERLEQQKQDDEAKQEKQRLAQATRQENQQRLLEQEKAEKETALNNNPEHFRALALQASVAGNQNEANALIAQANDLEKQQVEAHEAQENENRAKEAAEKRAERAKRVARFNK